MEIITLKCVPPMQRIGKMTQYWKAEIEDFSIFTYFKANLLQPFIHEWRRCHKFPLPFICEWRRCHNLIQRCHKIPLPFIHEWRRCHKFPQQFDNFSQRFIHEWRRCHKFPQDCRKFPQQFDDFSYHLGIFSQRINILTKAETIGSSRGEKKP